MMDGCERRKGLGIRGERRKEGKEREKRIPVDVVVFKEGDGGEAVVGPKGGRDPVGGVDALDGVGIG